MLVWTLPHTLLLGFISVVNGQKFFLEIEIDNIKPSLEPSIYKSHNNISIELQLLTGAKTKGSIIHHPLSSQSISTPPAFPPLRVVGFNVIQTSWPSLIPARVLFYPKLPNYSLLFLLLLSYLVLLPQPPFTCG